MTHHELARAACDPRPLDRGGRGELKAMQKRRELAGLLRFVMRCRPGVVVEVGSAHGGTLWAWARAAAPDALLVSVDLPNAQWEYGADVATVSDELAAACLGGQEFHHVLGDSHNAAVRGSVARLVAARGGFIDFLFVDGDHTEEGVERDFRDYAPLVRPGGIIGFHDVRFHPGLEWSRVDRFWERVRDVYRSETLVDWGSHGECGGIGVIFWDGAFRD